MKLMFASDIHGSAYYGKKVVDTYKAENADKLILLGDILYHGPRNALPKDYAPMDVAGMLNDIKHEILCVQGNCDADIDQMVLEFPIMAQYCILYLEGRMIFVTHGHIFNKDNPPMLKRGDILLHGHTHVPEWDYYNDSENRYLNPGSVSIPKENSCHSYLVYEDGIFSWKDIESGDVYHTLDIR